MEENRKTLTWVSLAGVLILAMMIVYPGVMDRISEYRKEEISLAGEQKLSAPQQGEAGAPQKLQTEEMPEILLSVEGENENTKVLLSAMLFDHGDSGFFLFRFDNKDFGDYASRLQEQECAVLVWMSVS